MKEPVVSTVQSRRAAGLVATVLTQSQAMVLLWDQAQDWEVPRIPRSQLWVLTALAGSGPTTLTSLARELGALPCAVSRACDPLEAAGLIVQKISAGSRQEATLTVSGEGQRRLEALASTRRADFTRVLEMMSPETRASLVNGLRQFSDSVARSRKSESLEAYSHGPSSW